MYSKTGRPPTRKLSDRKGYTRQKHNTGNAAADFLGTVLQNRLYLCLFSNCSSLFLDSWPLPLFIFLVGSDDGHEELLAAANAVIKTGTVYSEFVFLYFSILMYVCQSDTHFCRRSLCFLKFILEADGAVISFHFWGWHWLSKTAGIVAFILVV